MIKSSKDKILYYTGVGSRDTPINVMEEERMLASHLEILGFVLRTGDAKGSDQAFRSGVRKESNKIIYSKGSQTKESSKLALSVHPNPEFAKKFLDYLGRNPLQVLGDDLDEPSMFLVCWTPKGNLVGGTATTIKIAEKFGVKIFNLYKDSISWVLKYAKMIKEDKDASN